MLLLGKTMTAAELESSGLISAVFRDSAFYEEVYKRAELLASESKS